MLAGWQQAWGAGPREMLPSWYSRHGAGSADTCPEAGAGNQELYSELRDRSEISEWPVPWVTGKWKQQEALWASGVLVLFHFLQGLPTTLGAVWQLSWLEELGRPPSPPAFQLSRLWSLAKAWPEAVCEGTKRDSIIHPPPQRGQCAHKGLWACCVLAGGWGLWAWLCCPSLFLGALAGCDAVVCKGVVGAGWDSGSLEGNGTFFLAYFSP